MYGLLRSKNASATLRKGVKMSSTAHTNRLAQETSPYLLKHAHNPVDWYPWGQEAFDKAKKENKPIFLSIGYSTCRWCSVMERQSFENEEIGRMMNEWFVSVKVDREERPDVDKVYMAYIMATQGGGGWPMSVWLTPDLEPILGGTYFPPDDQPGRMGFRSILARVHEVWAARPDDVRAAGRSAVQGLREMAGGEPAGEAGPVSEERVSAYMAAASMERCTEALAQRFDARDGGFGGAPKFPRPAEIRLLLTEHLRLAEAGAPGSDAAMHMITCTLDRWTRGGLCDHLGGGFHRYSVDEKFHYPHFEKMLYDQPQMVRVLLAAWQIIGNGRFVDAARGTLDYLLREMRSEAGGLYSAQDAESLDPASGEQREGFFYVWTFEEVKAALHNKALLGPFADLYYLKEGGNADLSDISDPHQEFVGLNCLYERGDLSKIADKYSLPLPELEQLMPAVRQRLYETRKKSRPAPAVDDKLVAAWNGLALGAFAVASRILGALLDEEDRREGGGSSANLGRLTAKWPAEARPAASYLGAAEAIARCLRDALWDPSSGRLFRSSRAGVTGKAWGMSEDYAFVISGLLDLFEAGGDVQWLQWAVQLQETLDKYFWDDGKGGYFQTDGTDPSILLRSKEDYDAAEPAASSVAIENLARLAQLAPGADDGAAYLSRAHRSVLAFKPLLLESPLAVPQMAAASALVARPAGLASVVVVGTKGEAGTEALLNAAFRQYAPDHVVVPVFPEDKAAVAALRALNPKAVDLIPRGWAEGAGRAVAIVCRDFTCLPEATSPEALAELLSVEARKRKPASGQPLKVDLGALGLGGGGTKKA